MTAPLSGEALDALAAFDTPTICNALSALLPDGGRRNVTSEMLHCPFPERGAMVGYARTSTVRSARPFNLGAEAAMEVWTAYWRYLQDGPLPSVALVQDLDGERAGYGAFWGEINASVHRRLGCRGTVTDGSIRDLGGIPAGFQMLARKVVPSDGHVRLESFGGTVYVAGLEARSGDLIHADRHGAVVIPPDVAPRLAAMAARIVEAERGVIGLCSSPDFSLDALRRAWLAMGDLG
ncbi:MAG: RraA family protein [Dongiaceae bacterium]